MGRVGRPKKRKPWVRYEITGRWSGYRLEQSRIVHREYTNNEELAERIAKLSGIMFTDKTMLYIDVRQLNYRERKKPEIPEYKKLIRDCLDQNVYRVEDLVEL